jgi:hypothetical protein
VAAPFDLVKQFDAMRQQMGGGGGAPSSIQSYLPPQVSGAMGALHNRTATPTLNAPRGAAQRPGSGPARPDARGHYMGDGHDHSGGKGLVSFGGKMIASGLVNQARHLQGMGLRFTSGHRDHAHNRRVGGVPNSYHLRTGRSGALDFAGSARQMQAGAAWARANGAREVLIHNVGSGQHLHVAW